MSFKTFAIYIQNYASCFILMRISFSFRCFVSWLLLPWQLRNKTSALPSCDTEATSTCSWNPWSGCFPSTQPDAQCCCSGTVTGVRTPAQHECRASIVSGYRSTVRESSTEKIVLDKKSLQRQNSHFPHQLTARSSRFKSQCGTPGKSMAHPCIRQAAYLNYCSKSIHSLSMTYTFIILFRIFFHFALYCRSTAGDRHSLTHIRV